MFPPIVLVWDPNTINHTTKPLKYNVATSHTVMNEHRISKQLYSGVLLQLYVHYVICKIVHSYHIPYWSCGSNDILLHIREKQPKVCFAPNIMVKNVKKQYKQLSIGSL